MKLLFDQNISFRITKKLPNEFSGSIHVSDCGLSNCEDSEIWDFSKTNNFTIVTFDSDFYEISMISGHPPKIIWIRTGNITTDYLAELLVNNIDKIRAFLFDEDHCEIACLELE
jgi:predicted nuclease of predicted toxin-antitoxin system